MIAIASLAHGHPVNQQWETVISMDQISISSETMALVWVALIASTAQTAQIAQTA